jgi:PAS domain S-box-containing protein
VRTQRVTEQIGQDRRFQLLVGAVTDYAICLVDPDGYVASWNAGAERINGYAADEIIGRHFSVFFVEEDRQAGRPEQALATALRDGRVEDEGWRLRKDGSRFWTHSVLEAVRDENRRLVGFAKVTRDMTEQRAAQDALRQSERKFRLLVDSLIDYAIYMLDREGRITNWNAGAERIKGYRADEVLGEHFARFYSEEDRAAGLPARNLEIAASEGRFEAEGWRVRKDGSRFWANVVIDPIRDERGELIGFAKATRDLTERRAVQQRLDEAREQLFQAQKMEAIGQLTGGVAHDFNNLLTVILGNADLAEAQAGDNEKLRRLIGNMRRAAMRGETLTKQLLAFSRRQPLRPKLVELADKLQDITELLSHSLRVDIDLRIDIAPDLWAVQVDPSQLELAMLNIGVNARDAMPAGGSLGIAVRNVRLSGELGDLDGPFVAICMTDSGTGMADEVRARAFEPFFTTKGIGKGSGLGLSQAYGFAKQSGGTLVLDSAPGQGTTVTMYLRAVEQRPGGSPAGARSAAPRAAPSATILMVEDDPEVSELGLGLLQAAGYTVRAVADAAEALAVLRSGAAFDLVFSDIMMPGAMNGVDLARAIGEEFPGVFILLATGYAEAASSAAAQAFPLITKPYGRHSLLAKVAEILGEAE